MSYKMFMTEGNKQDWRDRKPGPVAYLVSVAVLVGLSALFWFSYKPTGKTPIELYDEGISSLVDSMQTIEFFIVFTVLFLVAFFCLAAQSITKK